MQHHIINIMIQSSTCYYSTYSIVSEHTLHVHLHIYTYSIVRIYVLYTYTYAHDHIRTLYAAPKRNWASKKLGPPSLQLGNEISISPCTIHPIHHPSFTYHPASLSRALPGLQAHLVPLGLLGPLGGRPWGGGQGVPGRAIIKASP